MTKEEAIEIIRRYECNSEHYEACEMAIQALEQEPCDDYIIRQAAIDAIDALYLDGDSSASYRADAEGDTLIGKYQAITALDELPSVQPMRKRDDVLDKVRAEIMSKDGLEEALEIIDKYRKESEE